MATTALLPQPTPGDRLLQADTPENVARVLVEALIEALPAPERAGLRVLWAGEWPQDIHSSDATPPSPAATAVADSALRAHRNDLPHAGTARVLCDSHDAAAVLLAGDALPASVGSLLRQGGARMCEVLAVQRLRGSMQRLEQAEQLQRALFAIADMASSGLDMPDMLRGLHRIVGQLMYAENFFIALYDRRRATISFVYFVDTEDKELPLPEAEVPLDHIRHGPTWWVVRTGRPLMGTREEMQAQLEGPLKIRGANSIDWLGVPLLREGHVEGVIVVQSYLEGVRFNSRDMALLTFVAEHILTALERKTSQEQLEARVSDRTRELAGANRELRREVEERERGERLQTALYQIAALANADESEERFFRHVHAVVGQLLYAENFYIALLSEDGDRIEFPYSVDQNEPDRRARPLGRGLTELVIRRRSALLVDKQRADELVAAGEIAKTFVANPTYCWLGAPLFAGDAAFGVVAVQSYDPAKAYDERDAELLTFVSHQLASSLQRRRSAEALRRANAELEERVELRTRELREQIAVREAAELRLQHQVMHDALTGLPNRLYLRDRVERAMARMRRDPSQQFGLLYIDVDRFKLVNDSLGHLAGDEVLKQVAQRLAESVREPDVVARLSGDEFAILLEYVAIPETASTVAQRVLGSMERPLQAAGRDLQTSASVGIAIGDGRHGSIDEVLRDADTALYRAKSAGRNRFVLFDEQLHSAAMDVLALEQELRGALSRDEFLPYFQPLVRLDSGETVGYEALLRWRHPQRGILAPGDFLQVAEDSGLIEAIDWRMFQLAMEQGSGLVRDGGFMTINVAPRMFQHVDLDERLLALTHATGFDPAKLRIEVTEGTLLKDPDAAAAVLQRLRDAFIETALDDFGTGYSSLGHVHRFPLKMLKIDRSFVSPISADGGGNERSTPVIGAILALASSLGLEVLAEGVETEAQRKALLAMGCVYAQGFLFARPQPPEYWLPD